MAGNRPAGLLKQMTRLTLVYTAVTGPSTAILRDDLEPLTMDTLDGSCDCVVFTNLPDYVPPGGWRAVVVTLVEPHPPHIPVAQAFRLLARSVKLRPALYIDTKPFDTAVWVDGNVEFLTPPSDLVDAVRPSASVPSWIATFAHHERNSVAKEISFVQRSRPNELLDLPGLEATLRAAKFKDDAGLFETCIVVRNLTPATTDFCTAWWDAMLPCGLRDQVVLPFVVAQRRRSTSMRPLRFVWRPKNDADALTGWPKAPWVVRNAHISPA